MTKKLLAFDFGASSGRGILAEYSGNKLVMKETTRFINDPVFAFGHYYWDLLQLFSEIKKTMILLSRQGERDIACMGVDTWGVDFALLDKFDKLISMPLFYRDKITDNEMEHVFEIIPKRELYSKTGIQFMKFNTIYQLSAFSRKYPSTIERAHSLLLMPDLFNFMLCGIKNAELTMASTTQLLDVHTRDWDKDLFERLSLPFHIMPSVNAPGKLLGDTTCQIFEDTGQKIKVASVCGHDTGSAYLAVPTTKNENSVFISCGTWSLLGVELEEPMVTEEAFKAEYTNEAGFNKSIRFLKNIMGLWIYQEIKRELEREHGELEYEVLDTAILDSEPFLCFIDPDAPEFFEKGNMCERVSTFCARTNQKIPGTIGEILRCVLESLALKYKYAIRVLEDILSTRFSNIRVVGGGCRDKILMDFTAKATGSALLAGPVEATAIGNVCAQLIAIGELRDSWDARELVANSYSITEYTCSNRDGWDEAYYKFLKIIG